MWVGLADVRGDASRVPELAVPTQSARVPAREAREHGVRQCHDVRHRRGVTPVESRERPDQVVIGGPGSPGSPIAP